MDDERRTGEEIEPQPTTPVEDEAPKKPQPSEAPVPALEGLSSGKEPWRGNSGCSARFGTYGCIIGVAILLAALIAGTSMMRRTVWLNFDNARRSVVNALPQGMSPAENLRTRRNLDRFRGVLERVDDPYPQMGEFVRRVRALLDDGRLTDEEVETLNLTLERWIEESGIPPMQLGFRISNFEFRMCRGAPVGDDVIGAAMPRRSERQRLTAGALLTGGLGGNPKSEIQNPKFFEV